ncbi:glycosyltransferase family A protein [Aquabacterium sp. G14]|uniref:glycosyltransferase family 2 protein n=1 Tax=Aquabacterium sp. G14 TaxID=3130164 RepID=UPI0030A8BD79
MSTNAQTISVVMPCYNGAHELAKTIDALLAQTMSPGEIIVVDDGSTDGSHEVAAAYGLPVKVIRQTNAGAAVARREGVFAASGDIIVFNDTGDVSRPERLRRLHDALVAHPQCVAAYGVTASPTNQDTIISPETGRPLDGSVHVVDDVLNRYLRQCWPLAVGMNLAVRREYARRCINIPSSFKAANDYAFQIHLAAEGSFVKVEEVLLDYEPSPGGISVNFGFTKQRAYALKAAAMVYETLRGEKDLELRYFNNRVDIEWPDIWLRLYLANDSKLRADVANIGIRYARWLKMPSRIWWALDKVEAEGGFEERAKLTSLVRLLRSVLK